MPHALTWPAGGDIVQSHGKPPEGGYYSNWDPYAVSLEVTPIKDVNPVRTQHVLVATVRDKDGKPLPNRRVEWMIAEGSVGDIVEVDESGWRASRGYKVDNHYAVSHTNNFDHVLDMGNDDPSDDIQLTAGQTWCVITSPIEGDTHITAYAPGIYDWSNHKVFVTKHWYDVAWEFPPPAVNPTGTTHEFVTRVMKHSDRTPLAGYVVNYRIMDGPAANFSGSTGSVRTDSNGEARITLAQASPAEGTNNIAIEIIRPEDTACCKPAALIAEGMTRKTWVGPKIGITKTAPAREMVGHQFSYTITVTNPSQVDAQNVVVSDTLPDGISYVSSTPAANASGSSLSWSLGTLAGGDSRAITVDVTGTRTGTFENCASVTADQGLSDRACAQTVITAPALVLEKNCPGEALICEPFQYTIIVRNSGDGPATNVRITDELPAGLTTTDGQRSVAATIDSLAPGEARQVQFMVQAERTGTFNNTARATADGGLSAEASCSTTVRTPRLEVSKTGPDTRIVNRPVQYQITVTNTGDAPAVDTMLVDNLPAGASFVSATDGGQASGGRVTWNLGTIQAGQSRNVSVTVQGGTIGTLRNSATATARCTEASDEVTTEIRGIPAILLEVVDVNDPIEVGTEEHYTITVTNQGSATGTNIRIVFELPSQLDFVSAGGPVNHQVSGKTITFDPLPSLAPRARATFTVNVRGVTAADARVKVSMTSDQVTAPVEETESTHVYE